MTDSHSCPMKGTYVLVRSEAHTCTLVAQVNLAQLDQALLATFLAPLRP